MLCCVVECADRLFNVSSGVPLCDVENIRGISHQEFGQLDRPIIVMIIGARGYCFGVEEVHLLLEGVDDADVCCEVYYEFLEGSMMGYNLSYSSGESGC